MFGFGFKNSKLGVPNRSQPVACWKGKMLKPINFDIETVLGFVLGTYMRCHKHKLIYKIRLRIKILKQIFRYTTNYIHNMPCHFVSSGVEIPMTYQTFDLIWNGFGNKELTDSKTSSSPEEGYKTGSLVEKTRHPEWRKQDDGYYNRKPNGEKH